VRLVLMQPVVDRGYVDAKFPRDQVDRSAFFHVQLNGAAFDFATCGGVYLRTGGNDWLCANLSRRAAPSSPPRRAHPFIDPCLLLPALPFFLPAFISNTPEDLQQIFIQKCLPYFSLPERPLSRR